LEHIRTILNVMDKKEGLNWGMHLKNQTNLIGIIGLYRIKAEHSRCEIGYMLLPEYHNKGLVTEAIQTVLNYAFDRLQFHSVEAIIDPRNYPSEKVLLKNGFLKEGHIKENEFFNGEFIDTMIYSILRKNFIAQRLD
ncbi:MAG: GNAT family protein, partial [Saprospiraceae bacterium]